MPIEVQDAPDAKELEVNAGKIEFSNVTFHYSQGKKVFENKSVVIEPGQSVGLVGFSGSGKTTFIHLILRFFNLEDGYIAIDGQDISQVTQDSLRAAIAMIPQNTTLFHRTLMENIRYAIHWLPMKKSLLQQKKPVVMNLFLYYLRVSDLSRRGWDQIIWRTTPTYCNCSRNFKRSKNSDFG